MSGFRICVDCGVRPATVFLPEGRYLCRPCWDQLRQLRAAVLRRRKSERGQAIVEFALVLPLLLAMGLGAADLGTYGLEQAVVQNAATTVAALVAQGLPEDDSRVLDELTRCGCSLVYVLDDSPRWEVQLARPHVSLTSLLPTQVTATASAVQPAPPPPEETP